MNLDIQHKHIKQDLIRTFAHTCELIDRSDLSLPNDPLHQPKPLELVSDMTQRNSALLSRISDYRIIEEANYTDQSLPSERLFKENNTVPTLQDPAMLRLELREQLYQCLLFLELCEKEGSRCMLSFRDMPDTELDAYSVIQDMLKHMHAYLQRLNAYGSGIAI